MPFYVYHPSPLQYLPCVPIVLHDVSCVCVVCVVCVCVCVTIHSKFKKMKCAEQTSHSQYLPGTVVLL